MKTWFRGSLVMLVLIVLILGAAPAGMGGTGETEPFVFSPTLDFFWNLTSLQVRRPGSADRLLRTDPWEPRKNLASLEVGIEQYESNIAEWGLSPVILFLRHGTDPTVAAGGIGLKLKPWPKLAPPALLSGPEVDTLVVFVPVLKDDRTKVGRARFLLTRDVPGDPFESRIYSVVPEKWRPSARIEHTRCGYPGRGVGMSTKLTYGGGGTDSGYVELSQGDWKPCQVSGTSWLKAAVVKQTSRNRAAGPVIVAGSYFQDPYPGPLLARWIKVN
ncbi:MAG TPA: hypothetical protein VFR31_13720 [Thermoanaerobaculia bacterium]|nr:hypothetical protein [Thermoanaerobaculia bacterium]